MKLNYDDKRLRIIVFVAYAIFSLFYLKSINASSLHVYYQAVSVAVSGVLLFPLWIRTQETMKALSRYFKRLEGNRRGAMYGWMVILVFLFIMVFLWAIAWSVIVPLRASSTIAMAQFVNHTSYPSWALADNFMNSFWTYFLALSVFAILLWSYHYAQRRGPRTA